MQNKGGVGGKERKQGGEVEGREVGGKLGKKEDKRKKCRY